MTSTALLDLILSGWSNMTRQHVTTREQYKQTWKQVLDFMATDYTLLEKLGDSLD